MVLKDFVSTQTMFELLNGRYIYHPAAVQTSEIFQARERCLNVCLMAGRRHLPREMSSRALPGTLGPNQHFFAGQERACDLQSCFHDSLSSRSYEVGYHKRFFPYVSCKA